MIQDREIVYRRNAILTRVRNEHGRSHMNTWPIRHPPLNVNQTLVVLRIISHPVRTQLYVLHERRPSGPPPLHLSPGGAGGIQ